MRNMRRETQERKRARRKLEREREEARRRSAERRRQRLRQRELEQLREKHQGAPWRAPMPDLSVEQRTAPTSDRFDKAVRWETRAAHVPGLAVGHLHKSGLQVLRREELVVAGRKV